MNAPRRLAILLFNDAELLDFCGPFEVFSVADRFIDAGGFEVCTVAESRSPVHARNGLSVNPDYSFDEVPLIDVLLVPGGRGARREIGNPRLLEWIGERAEQAELVLSVCTGALLLGKIGLLDGLQVTTHHGAYDVLREIVPSAVVDESRRYVDNGKIITSAGIAAGIDMSLYVVERLHGPRIAAAAAKQMEYPWRDSQ